MHEFLHLLYQMIRHLSPETLEAMINYVGPTLIYVVLFAIVFAETGLVVTPFLPGDSLLFAVGVVAATTKAVSLPTVLVTLCLAANCGDLLNYFFGYRIGPKVFSRENSRLLNKKHLMEAQRFYERHGRKTIILARFVPIVRTFAPFVAGIGRMNFLNFAAFSVTGGLLWVSACLLAGYKLAKVEFIRKHFDLVVVAIIVISVLPMIVHAIQAKRRGGAAGEASAVPERQAV
jgi:membrane-associated protein